MRKSSLNEVQKIFWKNLLSTNSDTPGLTKILERTQKGSTRTSALSRMFIYQEAYFLRILGVLKEDYPGLCRFISEKNFDRLIKEYIDANPSTHYSLRYIGSRLPSYLKKSLWMKKFPWAAELAAFEWNKVDLFDGIDHRALKKEDLLAVDQKLWPKIRFKLIPDLRILKTKYRVEKLSEQTDSSAPGKKIFKPSPGWIKMWRKNEEIYYSVMAESERKLLGLVKDGEKFSTICEKMAHFKNPETGAPNSVETVVTLLSKWIDEQVVENLSLK